MSTLVTTNRIAPQFRHPTKLPKDAPPDVLRYLKEQQNLLTQQWANMTQVLQSISMQGSLAERPTAGSAGRTYYATDNSHYYFDNGSSWVTLV